MLTSYALSVKRVCILGDLMSSKSIIRPLEGMRALAIISVLLFHVDFHFIPGGFLGVDLFFVISGFIISRILINEIEIGTFSFGNFYFKRFLRLFPALFLTLLVTLVVGYFVMTATPYAALGKSAIYTAASAANFNFWLESGYFDTDAHGKPLLHMWSLGVEEQFYLFWPALLVLFKGRFSRVTLILVLFILSLAASAYFSYRGYSAPFFMFPFRIYQFMLGAILAMMTFRLAGVGGSVLTLLAIIGFGFCCYFMSGETDTTEAGLAAGLIGFALIVSHSSPIARYVLGNPVMFWIGQRSYVTYLVHWPLIVLYKYATDFQLSLYEQIALLAGSFVLGEIVHHFIEAPFRMKSEIKRRWPDRIAVPVTTGLVVTSVFLASHVWGMKGFSRVGATGDAAEVVEIIGALDEQGKARSVAIRFGTCHLNARRRLDSFDNEVCAKTVNRRRNVLVIGNSLGADTYMLLAENFGNANFL